MTTEKTKKNEKKFSCLYCDFITCKKTDFNRHNLTQKHKNNVLTTVDNAKNEKNAKNNREKKGGGEATQKEKKERKPQQKQQENNSKKHA